MEKISAEIVNYGIVRKDIATLTIFTLGLFQFFLEEIVHSPSNILSDWMAYRKIKPVPGKDEQFD